MTELSINPEGVREVQDIWGGVQQVGAQTSTIVKNPINSVAELKAYEFPKINEFDFGNVERWIKDSDLCVAPQIDTGYFKIHQLTGYEDYCMYLYFNKSELHALLEKFTNFQIRMIDHLIDMGVDVIWLSDDHAFNDGPFADPQLLKEFDFDYMKQIVAHVHSRQIPVVLHCCGNMNYTIEMLIETGINGLHALQPSANNDIYKFKQQYGKNICLLGNMDINDLLPNGSPFSIDEKVQEMVENLFFDRTGFILATCNLLNNDTPVENAIAMHLGAEKHGR